jgi:tetratricopeptide (TPR) repeat protein
MRHLIIAIFIFTVVTSCSNVTENSEYTPLAIELNEKAVKYHQDGEYDSALSYFNLAIEADNNYYLPHSNKSTIYLSLKNYKLALHESELVIKKKPDFAEGWVFAGLLHDFLGDTAKARSYYKKSIEIFDDRITDPDKKEELEYNQISRAVSLILIGKEKEGKEKLENLKQRNQDNMIIDEFLKINKQDYIEQMNNPTTSNGEPVRPLAD